MARLNQRPSAASSVATPERSRGRPSGSTSRSHVADGNQGSSLPPYQKPIQPLSAASQRALNQLSQVHNLERLQKLLNSATDTLNNTAADANERLRIGRERQERKREKRLKELQRRGESGVPATQDEEPLEMEDKVRDLTDLLEEKVRSLVDATVGVEEMRDALKNLAGTSTAASTQRTARSTQRSTQVTDVDYVESQDADADGQEVERPTPSEKYTAQIENNKNKYQNMTMTERYATNNTYRNFRRVVHDALYQGENAPPLPNPSTWFPDGDAAAQEDPDDSDDDIAIAGEKLSLKCPLTLLPFKEPLTSRKCPHSFEKEAILEMISNSTERGSHREKVVRCPVCTVTLSANDLHTDPVLVRQIRRAQEKANMLPEDEDDEAEFGLSQRGPESVVSGADDDDDEEPPTARTRVKAERVRSSMRGA